MIIIGVSYMEIRAVYVEGLKRTVPLLDIPMMSDENWNQLAEQQKARRDKMEIEKPLNN